MAKRRANGEGNIRKRKDGRWEGRYTAGTDPVTGKAIIKNVLGKTQAEVKEKLKKAIAESESLDVKRSGRSPSPVTIGMYHPDSVVKFHQKILKDAGLEHIRFHDLRHTFATLTLQNGIDVKTVVCWVTAAPDSPSPPTPTPPTRCRNRRRQKWETC